MSGLFSLQLPITLTLVLTVTPSLMISTFVLSYVSLLTACKATPEFVYPVMLQVVVSVDISLSAKSLITAQVITFVALEWRSAWGVICVISYYYERRILEHARFGRCYRSRSFIESV
jgi:hypothetical protein